MDSASRPAGSHIGETVLQPEQWEQTIAFHRTLENKFLIVPWRDANEDPEVWKSFARFLDEAAAGLAPHGLYTGYHNHGHEFHALAGTTAWDVVAQNSGEQVVLQLDFGNARHGGGDAVAYLKKYLSRARTVHLKEFSSTNEQPLLGEGEIPWPEVLEMCEGSGVTEWLIVEQEVYPVPPLEAVRRDREFLRSLGR